MLRQLLFLVVIASLIPFISQSCSDEKKDNDNNNDNVAVKSDASSNNNEADSGSTNNNGTTATTTTIPEDEKDKEITLTGGTLDSIEKVYAISNENNNTGSVFSIIGFSKMDDFTLEASTDGIKCKGTPPELEKVKTTTKKGTATSTTTTNKCKADYSQLLIMFCNKTSNGEECMKPEVGKEYDLSKEDKPLISIIATQCKNGEVPGMWAVQSFPKEVNPYKDMMGNASLVSDSPLAKLVGLEEASDSGMSDFAEAMKKLFATMIAISSDLKGTVTFEKQPTKVGDPVKITMKDVVLKKFMLVSDIEGMPETLTLNMNLEAKLLDTLNTCDLFKKTN